MSNDNIKKIILSIVNEYSFKSVILFGSRASGTNKDDSEIDITAHRYQTLRMEDVYSSAKIDFSQIKQ